jgi:outer membrane receptor for ferrienterochelin and colicin
MYFCISLPANANNQDDIFDLSLEDLLNITVSVSTKKDKNLGKVPGSVTVYSSNDLNRLGYYTLDELADITPGYSTESSLGKAVFRTRGKVDNLNSKHLLLLDGIPINHARDFMAFSEQELPLQSAEKVEFLRGPASALYGVSAFHGVINITTKEAKSSVTESDSYFSIGSQNQKNVHVHSSSDSADTSFRITTSYYQKEASLARIPVEAPLRNIYRDPQKSIYLNSRYTLNTGAAQGASFGVIYMKKETGYGESWNEGIDTSELNRENRSVFIPYLHYTNTFSDTITFTGYAKYNESTETGTQTNEVFAQPFLVKFSAVTKNFEYLLETDWTPSERSSVIVGVNLDVRRQDDGESYNFELNKDIVAATPYFNSKSTTTSIYTQYSQDLTHLNSGLSLTLGARYDKGVIEDHEYNHVSPRVSIVQNFSGNWHAKFLFGTALKAPGVKEIGHNLEKSSGLIDINNIPTLDPETTNITELTLLYISKNHYMSLTYFETETDDSIFEIDADSLLLVDPNSGESFFINESNKILSNGFELEGRFQYLDSMWLMANTTFTETDISGEGSSKNVPRVKVNLTVGYDLKPFLITMISKYVDSYSSTGDIKDYSGQTILDLNSEYNLTSKSSIALSIKNIFDKTYFQADDGRDYIPKAGRTFLLTLKSRL